MKIQRLEFDNYKSFRELTLSADDFDDFMVLAGRNGTGKTALLEAIFFSLKPSTIKVSNSSTSGHPYVGEKSDVATIKIKYSLNDDEVAFIKDKFSRQHIYDDELQIDPEITNEFESIVRFYKNEENGAVVDLSQTYLSANIIESVEGNSTGHLLKHPLYYLVERQVCQSVAFFNAFRLPELNENQIFSQMPAIPSNSFGFATMLSGSGNAELRTTMTFPLIQAFSETVLYEAFKLLNTPEAHNKLSALLEPQLNEVNALLYPKKLLVPKFDTEQNRLVYSVQTPSATHSLRALSAGENAILILSTYIQRMTNGTSFNGINPIILIDEPELHLHSVFVERLAVFIKKQNYSLSHCLIASHSPDFINEFTSELRKIEDNKIVSITGLDERKKLFSEIGRKITPAALVENIAFTEGESQTTDKLPDELIYQKLLDAGTVKTLFVSVGNYNQPSIASSVTDKFLKAISESGTDNNLYMLTDGDDSIIEAIADTETNRVRLNVYHVENLLLDTDSISKAFNSFGLAKTSQEIEEYIKSFLPDYVESTLVTFKSQRTRKIQAKLFDGLKSDIRQKLQVDGFEKTLNNELAKIDELADEYKSRLNDSISSDEWRIYFKGHDILKKLLLILNDKTRKSYGYYDFQKSILDNTSFDALLETTKTILEPFRYKD